ncbi:chromatin modification-related protein EAF7-like [Cryptomeria japonica]|uniref:chromatin modification-related protein EAF7-like n=1 Tax=Cryptomeria japonica TaxID=3369 RepID=UPI0025ACE103|nr:chromatin modification-related protein EAF7-like [Cryptomeria japonica]
MAQLPVFSAKTRERPSIESEEDGSNSAFSVDEETDSDSSSDSEESMDVSDYETDKKRKHIKTRPYSFKGKKPKGKIRISLSSKEEVSKDSEKENPQGSLKKKSKVHTQTRNKKKRKEENVKEMEVCKQERTLEAEQNPKKVTMGEALRVEDITTIRDTPKKEQETPSKVDPPHIPPPEEKDMLERKNLADANEQTVTDTGSKVSKIEECLKSIVEQSLSILKISTNNTNTLISKLDEEKEILDIEPDTEGLGRLDSDIYRETKEEEAEEQRYII